MIIRDLSGDIHLFLHTGRYFYGLCKPHKVLVFCNGYRLIHREFTFFIFRRMTHRMTAVKYRRIAVKFVSITNKTEAENLRTDFGSGDQFNFVIGNPDTIF